MKKRNKNEPRVWKIGKPTRHTKWVRLSQLGKEKGESMLTDFEKSLRSHAIKLEKGERMSYHKKCIEASLKKKRVLTDKERKKIYKKTRFRDWVNDPDPNSYF